MATDCAAAIERPRVAGRIYDAMKARVTVISAPAGFGKTTAVAGVFADMPGVRVRLDLNAQNDTLFRFVEALSRVLEPIAPGARLSFAGAFDRALQSAKTEQSLALWLNEHLKGVHATIFMDQLHYLRETERVARFLTALVETAGKHIRWVFVSREDFGLPIPRWMSEDIMELPVDAHDLKFEFHEVAVAGRHEQRLQRLRPEAELAEHILLDAHGRRRRSDRRSSNGRRGVRHVCPVGHGRVDGLWRNERCDADRSRGLCVAGNGRIINDASFIYAHASSLNSIAGTNSRAGLGTPNGTGAFDVMTRTLFCRKTLELQRA